MCSALKLTSLARQPAVAFIATQLALAAPPLTGIGGVAVTHSPSRATTCTGRISPWFQAMPEPNRHNITVATAPTVPARVAMPYVAVCGSLPSKSNVSVSPRFSIRQCTLTRMVSPALPGRSR